MISISRSFAVVIAFASIAVCLGGLVGQDSDPSASPSPTTPTTTRSSPTPTPDSGAQNFHRWGSITTFNGMPSDAVHAIAQTPDGIMWFGTDNGLARFDGRRVERISLGDEASDRVQALSVNGGDLWIGTANGAFVYRDGTAQPVAGTSGLSVTAMTAPGENILGTEDGRVLFATVSDEGVAAVDEQRSTQIPVRDGRSTKITSLISSPLGTFVGTSGVGLMTLDQNGLAPTKMAGSPLFINSLSTAGNGSLLIGSDASKGASGVYELALGAARATRLNTNSGRVNAVASSDTDTWIGSDHVGAIHIADAKNETFSFANTSGGLRSDTIFCIFADREGVVWFGTNRGISRYDPLAPEQETVSDLPNSNFIRTLWRPMHALFAGSNRGLFESDGTRWNRVHGFEETAVYAIGANDNGMIVGTPNGVFDSRAKLIAAGDTRSIENFGKTYAAILGRGVVDISSGSQETIFPDPTASSLLAGLDRLWIGTNGNGLYSFDGKTVRTEASADALKSGTIWSLTTDGQSIWVAAQHGVFRLQNGKVERIIDAEDVRDIFVNGEDIWAATTQGMVHARLTEDLGWLVTKIGFEQGLPSDKTFSIAPGDGFLIATNRGVATYKPSNVVPKIAPIRVFSQRSHDLKELGSTISLDYPQNTLLVEVAGLSSRTFPEEFQYAWVLKKSNGDVVDRRLSHDPQYSPTGLRSGEYSIEVRAINRDLLLSDPLVVRFSVAKAPFPLTATALAVLLLIAIAGLIFAMIEHRRIRERNLQLATARLDLANEAERERRRIARDLHDQTLSDLRQLLMRADEMHAARLRTDIETISGEIRRICEDLSPSVLENVGLIAALEHLLTTTVANGTFAVDPELGDVIDLPMTTQLQVYRIVQEVLTNIRLHSDASKASVEIAMDEDRRLRFSVADDGNPFIPAKGRPHGRGIANIRSRADLIGGSVSWRPGDDGNRFDLVIG